MASYFLSPSTHHFAAVVVRPRSASLRSTRSGDAAASFRLRHGGCSFNEEGQCMLCPQKETTTMSTASTLASLSPCQQRLLLPDSNNNDKVAAATPSSSAGANGIVPKRAPHATDNGTTTTTTTTPAEDTQHTQQQQQRYLSYSQRWVVLSAVCLVALSNATQWISFAPLHGPLDAANAFYCVPSAETQIRAAKNESAVPVDSCDVELWSSQIFQLVGVLTGLVGMFVTDRFGIRISASFLSPPPPWITFPVYPFPFWCHFAALLNLSGAILRVISSLPSLDKHRRLPVLYFGQTVAAMSQPFFLCLSPKVAEHWFGEHQRALANSLSFIANPFGVVLGSIAPVLFVSNANDSSQILYLNVSLLALALAVSALTLCVTRARPPSPPSASSHCEHKPGFARGLQILFSSRIFYIQTLTFGMAFALQWSIFVTADKYFSRLQYPDKLAGYLLSVSAFSGTFASVLGGWVVDRTKKFNEFIKGAYVGIAIVGAALNLFLRHHRQSPLDTVLLSVLLTFLGFFAVPVFPISLELGVESTFPVAEATSSGLLIISGQLQLFLLTFGMQFLESKDWLYQSEANSNFQLSVDLWTLFALLSAIYSCVFLWPRYHRLEYEQNAIFRHLLPPRFDGIAGDQSENAPMAANTNGILLFPFAATAHKTETHCQRGREDEAKGKQRMDDGQIGQGRRTH